MRVLVTCRRDRVGPAQLVTWTEDAAMSSSDESDEEITPEQRAAMERERQAAKEAAERRRLQRERVQRKFENPLAKKAREERERKAKEAAKPKCTSRGSWRLTHAYHMMRLHPPCLLPLALAVVTDCV